MQGMLELREESLVLPRGWSNAAAVASVTMLFAVACSTQGSPCERQDEHRGYLAAHELPRTTAGHDWVDVSQLAGLTRLCSFPPVTMGSAKIKVAVTSPSTDASFLLGWLPDGLRADASARDALAVAVPGVFSEMWGARLHVLWADVGDLAGREVVKIRGSLAMAEDHRVMLAVWLPAPHGHYVAIALAEAEAVDGLLEVVEASIKALPQGESTHPSHKPLLIGAALLLLSAVTGLLAARVFRRGPRWLRS